MNNFLTNIAYLQNFVHAKIIYKFSLTFILLGLDDY